MARNILLLLAICTSCMVVADDATTRGNGLGELLSVDLFHSAGIRDNWKPRGRVILSSKESSAVEFMNTNQLNQRVFSYEPHQLTDDELSELRDASAQNGYYYLKAVARGSGDESKTVSTLTRACAVHESSLSDIITLSLDSAGNLLGVAVTSTNPTCASDPLAETTKILKRSFNTTFNVVQTIPAPMPDTQTYVQRMEQEKAERMKGDKGDNRSFLAKYWMYIVPLVIFMLITNAANPEGGDGGR